MPGTRLSLWSRFFLLSAIFLMIPLVLVGIYGKLSIYDPISVPEKPIAIVFGAAAWGREPSSIYADRLQQAAELFFAGKVQAILVSGDNSELYYNEPVVGKTFLVEEIGVPAQHVHLDYAGFRTFDTCARAKQIFQIDAAILVTQTFHLPRAIFYCRTSGIDAVGVGADKRTYRGIVRYVLREQAARWTAFWEATIFRHPPTVLGPPAPISSFSDTSVQ